MAIDPRDAFRDWLEAYVREVTREQLGYTEGEMDDAEQFLAIPATEPEPVYTFSPRAFRVGEAQLMGREYFGRWGEFSYSDHVFLYGMAISCEEDSRGN